MNRTQIFRIVSTFLSYLLVLKSVLIQVLKKITREKGTYLLLFFVIILLCGPVVLRKGILTEAAISKEGKFGAMDSNLNRIIHGTPNFSSSLKKDSSSSYLEEEFRLLFVWPSESYIVTDTFLSTGGFRGKRKHYGFDVKVKIFEGDSMRYSNIFASAGGIVKKGYQRDGYGYYIDIIHNEHMKTRYGHLDDTVIVRDGDIVVQGQIIARAGSKKYEIGRATGPHLHFEIMIKEKVKRKMRYTKLNPLHHFCYFVDNELIVMKVKKKRRRSKKQEIKIATVDSTKKSLREEMERLVNENFGIGPEYGSEIIDSPDFTQDFQDTVEVCIGMVVDDDGSRGEDTGDMNKKRLMF